MFIGETPLFFQKRTGLKESTFTCVKLKTLYSDDEKTVDDRRFRYGDFLRNTSLDELPQLINIIFGQMSLVGPRPLPVEYLPFFTNEERVRFKVKPGLTGWAQVNGRTGIDWESKLKYDIEYIQDRSFGLDLKIIILTLKEVLSGSGKNSLNEISLIDFRTQKKNTGSDITDVSERDE